MKHHLCAQVQLDNLLFIHVELHHEAVANAFYNGEIESELRRIGREDYRFMVNSDREKCMDMIEQLRCESVYPHPPSDCTDECKRRGKLQLHCWVKANLTDFYVESE